MTSGHFYWQDISIPFRKGESIAYAIFRSDNNIRTLGSAPNNQKYGLFCGIGACQGCLVFVDKLGITESCITKATEGLIVRPVSLKDRFNIQSGTDNNE